MSLDKWSIQNYKSKDVEVLVFSKYNAAKKMYFQNEVEEFYGQISVCSFVYLHNSDSARKTFKQT